MITINPYLNFQGQTEEAFEFYKSVFGGEFTVLQRFKNSQEELVTDPEENNKILHISLPIGKGNVLMGSDGTKGKSITPANNFYLSLSTESVAETEKIYSALSAGGEIQMPLQKTFWGAYFGMFSDKYRVNWMLNFEDNPANN